MPLLHAQMTEHSLSISLLSWHEYSSRIPPFSRIVLPSAPLYVQSALPWYFSIVLVFFMPRNSSCLDDTDAEDNALHLIFPPFHVLFRTLQHYMYIGAAGYTLYCPGTSIFSIALVFMMALLCSCPYANDADDKLLISYSPFSHILLSSIAKYAALYSAAKSLTL